MPEKGSEKKVHRRGFIKYGIGTVAALALGGAVYYAGSQTRSSPKTEPETSNSAEFLFPTFIDQELGPRINKGVFANAIDAVEKTDVILVRKDRPVSNFFLPLNVEPELSVVESSAKAVSDSLTPLVQKLVEPEVDLKNILDMTTSSNVALSSAFSGVDGVNGRATPLIQMYNFGILSAVQKYNNGKPYSEDAMSAAGALGSLISASNDVSREIARHRDTFAERVNLNNTFSTVIKETMGYEFQPGQKGSDFWDLWYVIGPLIFNEYGYFRRISARRNKLAGYLGTEDAVIFGDALNDVSLWAKFNSDPLLKDKYREFSLRQLQELEFLNTQLGINSLEKIPMTRPGVRRVLEEALKKPVVHEMLKLSIQDGNLQPGEFLHRTQDSILEYEWRTEEIKAKDIKENLEGRLMPLFDVKPDPEIYSTQVDAFRAFREQRRHIISGHVFKEFIPWFYYGTAASTEHKQKYFSAWAADVGHLDSNKLGYARIENGPPSHAWVAYWSKGRETYCVRTAIFEGGKWNWFDPAFEDGCADWRPGYSTVPGTDGEGMLHVPAMYANNHPKLKIENLPTVELYPEHIRCNQI